MEASWRRAIFPVLLAAFAALYVWRMSDVLPVEGVTSHLSNLYLTGAALTLASGPRAFIDAGSRARPLVAAVALGALNVGLEVALPALGVDDEVNDALADVNTSDPIDALFGLSAVLLVLALLPRRRSTGGSAARA